MVAITRTSNLTGKEIYGIINSLGCNEEHYFDANDANDALRVRMESNLVTFHEDKVILTSTNEKAGYIKVMRISI